MLRPTALLAAVSMLAPLAISQHSTDDPRLAAEATAALGLDLYRELASASPDSNLVLSPWSIAVALAMTTEGARGETQQQLLRLLRVPNGHLPAAHASFGALMHRLDRGGGAADDATRATIRDLRIRLAAANDESEKLHGERKWDAARQASERANELARATNEILFRTDRYELRTACSIWVDRSHPLIASFDETLRPHYGTNGTRTVDFVGDAEGARKAINTWVADHTAGRIRDFVPPGTVHRLTRMALVDAVWFRGAWQVPFETSATRDDDFTLHGGERVRTRTMHDAHREGLRYGAFHGDGRAFATPRRVPAEPNAAQPVCYPGDDGFLAVELPYRGNELAMLVVLPQRSDGLPAIERGMTSERLAAVASAMQPFGVDLALPTFSLRKHTPLDAVLQSLGATRAFAKRARDGYAAEFAGMSDSRDGEHGLRIDAVLHEAWIETGEEGTEAAAATGVFLAPDGAMPQHTTVPFRPVFHADRPFLFAIRDTVTGAILFVGRVADPRA